MKIDGTTLSLDIYELIRMLPKEQCDIIADALAMNESVRKHVVDAILRGYTDHESSPTWDDLDAERKRLIEGVSELVDHRIARLESALSLARKHEAELRDKIGKLWDLYHSNMLNRQTFYSAMF